MTIRGGSPAAIGALVSPWDVVGPASIPLDLKPPSCPPRGRARGVRPDLLPMALARLGLAWALGPLGAGRWGGMARGVGSQAQPQGAGGGGGGGGEPGGAPEAGAEVLVEDLVAFRGAVLNRPKQVRRSGRRALRLALPRSLAPSLSRRLRGAAGRAGQAGAEPAFRRTPNPRTPRGLTGPWADAAVHPRGTFRS